MLALRKQSLISPRVVAELQVCHSPEAPPSLLAASETRKYTNEIRRLKQENMQLRRDLEDANNRIRELEGTQRTPSLFMPSSSYADSDDFSVEVSVTSSMTTVPMGSLSTNQNQEIQQERGDREAFVGDSLERGAKHSRGSSRRKRNPFSQAVPRKIPELRRLFSSESESSLPGSNPGESPSASSRSDVALNKSALSANNQVSSYAMSYFQRADSADSDTVSTGNSSVMYEV